MATRIAKHYKKVLFQLRWLFMSPQQRYAYLWQQGKHHGGSGMKKLIIGLVLVSLVLVPVACFGETETTQAPSEPDAFTMPSDEIGDKDNGATLIPDERLIVHNGDMSLVVDDVVQTRDEIARLAERLDGYVVSSQISGEEQEMRGWITIRVPDESFEPALAEIRNLAVRVASESTSSQDVTEEYIDLESRLRNAEATESQYLALLEKATNVNDILKIYDSLSQIRGEIEQIKGRMQYLEQTSSMALITASLEPAASSEPLVGIGWSALEALKSAIRGIITFGQWLATGAIWLLIFSPIWGSILGVILWRWRLWRKRKQA